MFGVGHDATWFWVSLRVVRSRAGRAQLAALAWTKAQPDTIRRPI